jgi:hypothetical protein
VRNNLNKVSMSIAVFILCVSSSAKAEEFSADLISRTSGGVLKGKIFVSKDRARMETREAITITRMDKKTVWVLMPKDKKYLEQAFDPIKAAAITEDPSGVVEQKFMGQEIIDGRQANKYEVKYDTAGMRGSLLEWFTPGFHVPVKTAAVDNSWALEYKSIKNARQPDELFEIPADYEKISGRKPAAGDSFNPSEEEAQPDMNNPPEDPQE